MCAAEQLATGHGDKAPDSKVRNTRDGRDQGFLSANYFISFSDVPRGTLTCNAFSMEMTALSNTADRVLRHRPALRGCSDTGPLLEAHFLASLIWKSRTELVTGLKMQRCSSLRKFLLSDTKYCQVFPTDKIAFRKGCWTWGNG